ncbi:uncharacterized protein RVIR1_09060 [Candidatus Rickettsiella viridis]|uniref:Calcium-dependent cell adhesion molecule N-terminal domain-containing protein n=2 Tax=Candidatus Rickettsiella viridis TaxID=676208 RepID=A0A2Z5UUQ3_9COXI|nr:uncharacterized protein RVIR1_09060 [Candidatus Rickettsiella viridis]
MENMLNKLEKNALNEKNTILSEKVKTLKLKKLEERILLNNKKNAELLENNITKKLDLFINNHRLEHILNKPNYTNLYLLMKEPEPKKQIEPALSLPKNDLASNEIIFYSEKEFSGLSFKYRIGDKVNFTNGPHPLNDLFKSAKLGSYCKVTLYEDGDYVGKNYDIITDTANIQLDHGGISSFIVDYKEDKPTQDKAQVD